MILSLVESWKVGCKPCSQILELDSCVCSDNYLVTLIRAIKGLIDKAYPKFSQRLNEGSPKR